METEKLSCLTTMQLQKRKKFAFILLVILIAAVVMDGSALVYNLAVGKDFSNALFVAAAACILIFIPIYMGKKNIERELNNREDNQAKY